MMNICTVLAYTSTIYKYTCIYILIYIYIYIYIFNALIQISVGP